MEALCLCTLKLRGDLKDTPHAGQKQRRPFIYGTSFVPWRQRAHTWQNSLPAPIQNIYLGTSTHCVLVQKCTQMCTKLYHSTQCVWWHETMTRFVPKMLSYFTLSHSVWWCRKWHDLYPKWFHNLSHHTVCDCTKNDTICTQNEVIFDRITQCVMIRKKIPKLKNVRCVIPHDYYRLATTTSESLEVPVCPQCNFGVTVALCRCELNLASLDYGLWVRVSS